MADTRERFIDAATSAFAERGFYGTSIAAIVDALPFTKQALLHHFGSKEKLYAEVLKRISDTFMDEVEAVSERYDDPRERLEQIFIQVYRTSRERPDETRLLLRELLDNRPRAETVRTWYLKPFLEHLVDLVMAASGGRIDDRKAALAIVYPWLGAINYFVVSEPTLARMFGRKDYLALQAGYEDELRTLITSRLDAR